MGMRLSKKNTAIELYFIFVVVFAVIALDIAFAIVYVMSATNCWSLFHTFTSGKSSLWKSYISD